MSDERRRIQVTFRLDNPDEKIAFEMIQSAPTKKRSRFITDSILSYRNENALAERIAEKLLEKFSEKQVLPVAAVKRKRGRPPKQIQECTIKKTSTCKAQKKIKCEEVEHISGERNIEKKSTSITVDFNSEQDTASEVKPEEKQEIGSASDDLMLDDDMLRSMESFINF